MPQVSANPTILTFVLTLSSIFVTIATLSLGLGSATWSLPPRGPVIPIVFRDTRSVAPPPTVTSDLQALQGRRQSLTGLFLTVMMKGMSSGASQMG